MKKRLLTVHLTGVAGEHLAAIEGLSGPEVVLNLVTGGGCSVRGLVLLQPSTESVQLERMCMVRCKLCLL